MENQDKKLPKQYHFEDSKEAVERNFFKSLQEVILWAQNSSEEWAKLKTYDLPKELVVLNLGILAFVGALRNDFNDVILIVIAVLASLSIITSFVSIRWITNMNIKSISDRRMIMQYASERFLKGDKFEDVFNEYNQKMAHAQGELMGNSKLWKKIDYLPVFFFLLSIVATLSGLFIK